VTYKFSYRVFSKKEAIIKTVRLENYSSSQINWIGESRSKIVPNMKGLWLRKCLPYIFTAIIIRSENGAPITAPIILKGGLFLYRGSNRPDGG